MEVPELACTAPRYSASCTCTTALHLDSQSIVTAATAKDRRRYVEEEAAKTLVLRFANENGDQEKGERIQPMI